jgi:hypothetical protein
LVVRVLPFENLHERHVGVTKAIADSFLEAAIVCLDKHHVPPQLFSILNGNDQVDANASWKPSDDRTKSAWANEIDATEWGAYGFAIAALEVSEDLYAIHRAETRTGSDYYIAPLGHSYDDLEDALRLEVSGTASDDLAVFESRLNTKIKQAKSGQSNLPAVAAVVGFRLKLIKIRRVSQN